MATVFTLRDQVLVRAPVARCFLLSTSIALVQSELHMQPVAGRTSGLVASGDSVLWRGWKFGLLQIHESLIEAFQPPVFFRDRMVRGRFAAFEHDHRFLDQGEGTVLLSDEVRFQMRYGCLGEIAGRFLLEPHIRDLLRQRFARLKSVAEGDLWGEYLGTAGSDHT